MTSVLVVDDVADNVKLLSYDLEDQGYEVSVAYNGPEALQLASTRHPDVILLDVRMPDMDGIEVCRRLKENAELRLIPVILVTAKGLEEDIIHGLDAGADDYVVKPFNSRILAARLRSAVRDKSSHDAIARVNEQLHLEVTERKRAEAELTKAKEAAEAASNAKSHFLANMSHEIRTPMTAIVGFADILLGTLEEPAAVEAANIIRRNGENLLGIINDILDLSKIEAGRLQVERTPCSPCQIVAEVASLMRVRADAKGLLLTVEYPRPIPERITTDPTRLRQILVNLVGNAIKFSEVGSVRIVTRLLGNAGDQTKLQFDVIDTGIGLTREKIGKIFEPFAQGDTSMSRKFGGTGLGLTISKRLAKMLGGDITVTSVAEGGSTFSVTITTGPLDEVRLVAPSTEAVPATRRSAPRAAKPQTKLACRILLAEDGPDNQRLISFLLKKAGADVTVAENGQVAVDLALAARDQGNPFDVILMDMQMPVLDGYLSTKKLRAEGFTEPVIALTAHAMTGDRQKCLDAGCDDYAAKPIDRRKLIELVAKHLWKEPELEVTSNG